MGCGTVQYNGTNHQESRAIFKPYPEEINGINDKVSNSFNNFLKNHGAITKPSNRDRPKLNFDIKDSKNFRKSSVIEEESRKSVVMAEESDASGKFVVNLIEPGEGSERVPEEKSFFIQVPNEFRPAETKGYKFSITIDADKMVKELNLLEDEAELITNKYL